MTNSTVKQEPASYIKKKKKTFPKRSKSLIVLSLVDRAFIEVLQNSFISTHRSLKCVSRTFSTK